MGNGQLKMKELKIKELNSANSKQKQLSIIHYQLSI